MSKASSERPRLRRATATACLSAGSSGRSETTRSRIPWHSDSRSMDFRREAHLMCSIGSWGCSARMDSTLGNTESIAPFFTSSVMLS